MGLINYEYIKPSQTVNGILRVLNIQAFFAKCKMKKKERKMTFHNKYNFDVKKKNQT